MCETPIKICPEEVTSCSISRSYDQTSVCVFALQVQNISQSMEVLDLRTYRDLQYVRNTESLMKVVDGKLKVASENPRNLNPKGFQVTGWLSPPVP